MTTTAITKEAVFEELQRLKAELAIRYGVTRIGLFGSVARNEAGPESDIDVVVEMQPNLYMRAALKAELEERFGRPVDVIRYRPEMNAYLKQRIDREVQYV